MINFGRWMENEKMCEGMPEVACPCVHECEDECDGSSFCYLTGSHINVEVDCVGCGDYEEV